jgi:PqqD family protein of HPr-rel-A system
VGWESRKGSDPFPALGSDPTSATFRIPERVLSRHVGGELVLLHLTTGMYHVLNETGARVWELLARGDATDRIAAALAEDYEVDPEQAAADVNGVIAELRDAKLIEVLR